MVDLTQRPKRDGAGYAYDQLKHLVSVTRTAGESESLFYAPGGELLYRQVGEKFVFYVGEYATVTARGATGCSSTSSCTPQPGTVEVDAHVIFAGTRVASAKPSRTLYYYRTRLGTVIATSLNGGRPGAAYRYTPYGEVEHAVGETDETRSELGYTNALRLSGSLLYLKARVYDTQARVFIQADEVDRLRYAYVQGDPVNSSDPTGLMPLGPYSTVMLDGIVLSGGLGERIAERMMMASHGQAADVAPSNEEQTETEGAAHKPDGIALLTEAGETAKGALDGLTTTAENATAALADYSVDSNNNIALRAGAAVLGSMTGLFDKDTIGKTTATLAIGGVALIAAPVVIGSAAEGSGVVGLAQNVAARATGSGLASSAGAGSGAAITAGSLNRTLVGRQPASLAEQLTMKEAIAGAGRVIMTKFADPRYQAAGWEKVQHVHARPDGQKIVVHYMRNAVSGAAEQFKFKSDRVF